MASPTDIANLALTLIGEEQIVSLADPSTEPARVCAVNYPQARDECLQMAQWGFAKRQAEITKQADAPLFDWTAAFRVPEDFLRLVKIAGCSVWDQEEYFDVQGPNLLVRDFDRERMAIEYIRREEDSGLYSPLFIEALSYKLAMKICTRLTDSKSRENELLRVFEQVVMPRCMTVDAKQKYSGKNHPIAQMMGRSGLINARRRSW